MGAPASRNLQSSEELFPEIINGLKLLMQAFNYAHEVSRDVWDFAVEIECLQDAGLTFSDLRWLVCRDYVEHAREITVLGDEDRAFRKTGTLTFTKRTCFVLTTAAVPLFRKVVGGNATTSQADNNGHSPAEPHVEHRPKSVSEN